MSQSISKTVRLVGCSQSTVVSIRLSDACEDKAGPCALTQQTQTAKGMNAVSDSKASEYTVHHIYSAANVGPTPVMVRVLIEAAYRSD